MSTTSTPYENPRFPSLTNIPRLEQDGSNWAIFQTRFQMAMIASNYWECFEGSRARPIAKDPTAATKEEEGTIAAWEKDDNIARYLLSQRLPDSAVLSFSSCSSVQICWKLVTEEYRAKSAFAKSDLEQVFLEMRCPKGGDVRTFLTSLRSKREELSAVGVAVSDWDYQKTVLKGVPDDLATFAAQLLSSRRFNNLPDTDTDTLINHICEEADRGKHRPGGSAHGKRAGGGKKEGADEALAATGSEDRKGRKKGKCHNCGKPGHWARECRSAKKDPSATETSQAFTPKPKAETKPVGSANAVTGYDSEGDGFWMAIEPEDQP